MGWRRGYGFLDFEKEIIRMAVKWNELEIKCEKLKKENENLKIQRESVEKVSKLIMKKPIKKHKELNLIDIKGRINEDFQKLIYCKNAKSNSSLSKLYF